MYVWFDALLNYYTALSFAREGEDLTEKFWPVNWHFIAKDILKFHAVYWPAFLMAAEIEVPQRELIHGYLLMEGHKMSKSLGNVLDPVEVIERFGADALRFYCFREVSFGQDGAVSTEGFEQRYETELANDWGNLASRTLAMIERYRDGVVPEAELDPALCGGRRRGSRGWTATVRELLDEVELTAALEAIWSRVRRLNRYVEESRPWDLAKDAAESERLDVVLYSLARGPAVPRAALALRTCPTRAGGCSRRWPRAGGSWTRSARAAAARRSSGSRPVSQDRRLRRGRGRYARPPRPVRAGRRRAGRLGARRGGLAHSHGGTRRGDEPRGHRRG